MALLAAVTHTLSTIPPADIHLWTVNPNPTSLLFQQPISIRECLRSDQQVMECHSLGPMTVRVTDLELMTW